MPRFVRPPDPADPAAFQALVLAWWGYCERWAARMEWHNPGRDFGPQANIALWRAAATFSRSGGASFLTHLKWELYSARTIVRRGRPPARTLERLEDEPYYEPEEDEPARDRPEIKLILPLLDRLPAKPQEVIRLHYLKGIDDQTIGRRLGCTPRYVQSIRSRAIKMLQARARNPPPQLRQWMT